MVLRVLALAIAGEAIPGGRGRITAPWPFVAGIGPEPRGLGLAGAGREHLDRRVIGEDRLGRQDMSSDGVSKGFQQGGGLADPVGQRGSVEIDALTAVDLCLAIQMR